MTVTTSRRADLASFLRTRRERLTPEAVGLPAGPRRRTPGLRREEVAQLAGVGVTWYTWLEQGRPIRASVQVLDAVSRTLRLDPAEHEHLYRLADVPSPPPGPPARHAPEELRTVLAALDPLPACVLTERYDVLAANATYRMLFPALDEKRSNILWCLFSCTACDPFTDRAAELPRLVAKFRAAYARHAGESEWDSLVASLQRVSPLFTELWHTHDVAAHDISSKSFFYPRLGTLLFTATSLGVMASPDLRLTVYTPEDEHTTGVIAGLLAGELYLPPCPHHA